MMRKLFSSIAIAIAIAPLMPLMRAYAGDPIIQQNCDGVTPRTEPLDLPTEGRLRRYIQSEVFPHTFRNQIELERWCALWNDLQELRATRAAYRANYRIRTLQERFYIMEPETLAEVTTDKELAYFPLNRQARILARVKTGHCGMPGTSEEANDEYAVCRALVAEQNAMRIRVSTERRIENLSLRTEKRRRGAIVENLGIGGDYTAKSADASTQKSTVIKSTKRLVFDPFGPGSVPLSTAQERGLARYVDSQECARAGVQAKVLRCTWLVQQAEFNRMTELERVQARLTNLGVLGGATVRRAVSREFRSDTSTMQSILNARILQGFRPSPRTIKQAQENFQTPVIIQGDPGRVQEEE